MFNIPMYKVKDCSGEEIRGSFYEPELSKVEERNGGRLYEIEKILETKKENGVEKYLVKYLHYPKSCAVWVNKDAVKTIK